jgi:adenosylcobinamide-GDP ribazoletransferase
MNWPERWTEAKAACGLLSRLPGMGEAPPSPRMVWAFPLAGAALGAFAGLVHAALRALGLPSGLAALGALGALTVATGALHEDGLADTADALGARGTRERRLAVLQDSRIGTFGASALFFSFAGRAAAVAAIGAPGAVARAWILAGALSRTALLLQVLVLPPARPEGLGARLTPPHPGAHAAAWGLASLAALLAAPLGEALAALLLAALLGSASALLSRRAFGGYTGDTLGAGAALTELALLACAARG